MKASEIKKIAAEKGIKYTMGYAQSKRGNEFKYFVTTETGRIAYSQKQMIKFLSN